VEAAGGVDDDDVSAAGLGGLDRVESDGSRVGAPLCADEICAGPLRPDLELLVRRSAERVGGGQGKGPDAEVMAVNRFSG